MIPSLEAETQGTANSFISTAQSSQYLHVSKEGPVLSMSTTLVDIQNQESAISIPGIEMEKVLEEDFATNHEVQLPEANFHDNDYFERIRKLQVYLDMVKKIVKPGCSQELLNVALDSMSGVVGLISRMSSSPFPHSSL